MWGPGVVEGNSVEYLFNKYGITVFITTNKR
jgi:hypothetical protein